ncbi:hypothetical protein ABK040_005205 [Willaertia magna]
MVQATIYLCEDNCDINVEIDSTSTSLSEILSLLKHKIKDEAMLYTNSCNTLFNDSVVSAFKFYLIDDLNNLTEILSFDDNLNQYLNNETDQINLLLLPNEYAGDLSYYSIQSYYGSTAASSDICVDNSFIENYCIQRPIVQGHSFLFRSKIECEIIKNNNILNWKMTCDKSKVINGIGGITIKNLNDTVIYDSSENAFEKNESNEIVFECNGDGVDNELNVEIEIYWKCNIKQVWPSTLIEKLNATFDNENSIHFELIVKD